MRRDTKTLLVIIGGSLVLGVIGMTAVVVMLMTRPQAESRFPKRGWSYGAATGLFRDAETAAACSGLGGAAEAALRAHRKREDAGSVDDLVKASREGGRAARQLDRAASACGDTIMTLEPDTQLTVLQREGTAYRVEVPTSRGNQAGWVSVDRVTLENRNRQ
jgi:hypothetical protein